MTVFVDCYVVDIIVYISAMYFHFLYLYFTHLMYLLRLRNLRRFKTVYNIFFKYILRCINKINCFKRVQLHVANLCPFRSLALYEDGRSHCDVSGCSANTCFDAKRLVPLSPTILGFRFVLKSEDCIFGCVGGTAGKPTTLGTTLWPFFPQNLTKLDKMDISAYLMSFFQW